MKAIAKDRDYPGLSVIEIDEPKCSPNQVLIKPRACGICGTDMYTYRWEKWVREMILPHMPVVIGHEFGGEIIEIGSGVKDLRVGDWVAVEPIIACGNCFFCRTGRGNMCNESVYLGVHCHGAMAELVTVPSVDCYKVPKTIPFADISLLEVLATGIHALERIRPIAGATVAILGVGAIGLLLVQAVRAYGAAKIIIIATSRSQSRLNTARELGADEIIMVDKEDLITRINTLTDGGADVVLEAAGTASGCEEAIKVGRKGSQVVLLGACDAPVTFVPIHLLFKEMDIMASLARSPSSWYTSINLVTSGKISIENIIDARFSIADSLKGFELLERREITKAVIEP